jgi:hypothetical protein
MFLAVILAAGPRENFSPFFLTPRFGQGSQPMGIEPHSDVVPTAAPVCKARHSRWLCFAAYLDALLAAPRGL